MPIRFRSGLAAMSGLTQAKLDQLREESDKLFVYKHMNNGSGICPECAPWLNMETTGTGSDGVPIPPLHPRCKCFLMPKLAALLSDHSSFENGERERVEWAKHFEWLESLPEDRLALIIGKTRAKLVKSGELKVQDLYDGKHLKTLDQLGYGRYGIPKALLSKAEEILSDPAHMSFFVDLHSDFFMRLPPKLRGKGRGDRRAVTEMVAIGLRGVRDKRYPRRPQWLVILLESLREILPDDEL